MGFFDWLLGEEDTNQANRGRVRQSVEGPDTEFAEENNVHMDLRQEELDIDKHRVQTGNVVIDKDIVEEEQVVNVPISHDQVVIEQRAVNHEPTNEPITEEETISIPVTAERVDVDKHTVVTGEVTAHKRPVEENTQVREVLHKEVVDINGNGEADIINERER